MRTLRPAPARLLVFLLVPFLGGCLRFATQTIEYSYDAAQDRATLHLVYHGLFWDKDDQEEGHRALQRAVDGHEFCLIDWPFHFSPANLRREKHPVSQFIGAHTTSSSVGFFRDADGHLSGGQVVVLEKVGELLALVNAQISKWLMEGNGRPEDSKWDRHTGAMLIDAAKRGHAWVRVRGNAIELHAFCSDHDYAAVKRAGLLDLLASNEEKQAEAVAWLARLPVAWQRDGSRIVVVFGNASGRTRFDVPREGRKPYRPNLYEYAQKTWGLDLDRKVAPKLIRPDDTVVGKFARSLSLRERVRILLAQDGDEAVKRLYEALDELSAAPATISRPTVFWQAWIETRKKR